MSALHSLTAAVTEALRAIRTAALRVLGPFETMARRLAGREPLPPLWLRRHTGYLRDFQPAARAMALTIESLGLVRPGDFVVDAGCGCGAMVPWLTVLFGTEGQYLGFDVHKPSIEWCRKRYAADHRLKFELAEVATPYSGRRGSKVDDYAFPVPSGQADFVLAKSLFTHLQEGEACHYLEEIARILRPGRKALVTAFLFDPGVPTPAFPFPDLNAPIRWRLRKRPHAGIAYARPLFERMVCDAGLKICDFDAGFWPGTSPRPTGQDTLLLAGK